MHPYPGGYPPQYQQPPRHRTAFGYCLAAALVWAGATLWLLLAIGPPLNGGQLTRLLGFLAVPWLSASLVTWLIFRRRRRRVWLLVLVSMPFFFMVLGAALGTPLARVG